MRDARSADRLDLARAGNLSDAVILLFRHTRSCRAAIKNNAVVAAVVVVAVSVAAVSVVVVVSAVSVVVAAVAVVALCWFRFKDVLRRKGIILNGCVIDP